MRLTASTSPLEVAAVLRVDHRIAREVEHIAGDDDVRSAEEDDAVAIGVRGGLVQHLNRFAVEEQRS